MTKSYNKALSDLRARLEAAGLKDREIVTVKRHIDLSRQLQPVIDKNLANSLMLTTRWESSYLANLRKLQERHEKALKALSKFHDPFSDLQKQIKQYQTLFQNPSNERIGQAFAKDAERIQKIAERFHSRQENIQRFAEQFSTRWMQIEDSSASISGLSKMYGIGSILSKEKPFSEDVSQILRHDLGDWRDVITSPHAGDTIHELYQDIGFDHQLIDFPTTAFRRGVADTNIRIVKPRELRTFAHYLSPPPDDWKDDGDRFRDEAYEWLAALETHLRRFIDQEMTKLSGRDWPRHRLPNGRYEEWLEKKNKSAEESETELHLINFADFTDYQAIILRRDNWKDVFQHFFERPESVRESFNRMHPIRRAVGHIRPISHEAYLTFHVECNRLIKAIKR